MQEFVSDNLDRRGFINKEDILRYVTQEQVFKLVFGFEPEEFQYLKSPFRKDRSPGCWFEYSAEGRLFFKDFGNPSKRHYDCFDAVMIHYKIPNFYMTLEFVFNSLIRGKNIEADKRILPQITVKDPVRIIVETRHFEARDGQFNNKYGISKENLIEDKVFPFSRYHLLNTKSGSFSKVNYDIGYAFTDFPEGRKKLYFPYRQHKERFLSTCNRNDIGGIKLLPAYGRQLIITKSWKDYRVLRNKGKNVIWLQNEGMFPDMEILLPLIARFKEVIILFDNDFAGIEAATKLSALINYHCPGKCKPLWLPERLLEEGIKDPSDLYFIRGTQQLTEFLNYRT